MPAPGPDALVDAVDELNEPVGVVPRGEVFIRQVNFRTVHVLIYNAQGDLLLQRLSPRRERHGGQWGSSVAGYLFAGESYQDAAVRRGCEELGLSAPLEEVGVLQMEDEGVSKFIGVFTAVTEDVSNCLPEHIADLDFRPVAAVRRDIAESPHQFTASLREVFAFVGEARGGGAAAG